MPKEVIEHSEREKLELYKSAFSALVRRAGGSVVIDIGDMNRMGSILNRPCDDGWEFKVVDEPGGMQ